LQLALVLVTGLAQLSPGAYFLRTDLFPAIVDVRSVPLLDVIRRSDDPFYSSQVILGTDTRKHTFEAMLLLALLANFHKSDAPHQNPYIAQIRQTQSRDLLQMIAWASNTSVEAVVK
jgi:hypothetical protein